MNTECVLPTDEPHSPDVRAYLMIIGSTSPEQISRFSNIPLFIQSISIVETGMNLHMSILNKVHH